MCVLAGAGSETLPGSAGETPAFRSERPPCAKLRPRLPHLLIFACGYRISAFEGRAVQALVISEECERCCERVGG
jgi:hypothetical protein